MLASNRIMVGLPTLESRELIMKKLLSKEKVKDIDFKELAKMTEGYSGSDLKVCILVSNDQYLQLFMVILRLSKAVFLQNLCVTAAYRPVRELLQKEKEMKKVTNPLSRLIYILTNKRHELCSQRRNVTCHRNWTVQI